MKKILILTSTERRHKFFAKCVRDEFRVRCDIFQVEKSQDHIVRTTDLSLNEHSSLLTKFEGKHFDDFELKEFVYKIRRDEINSEGFINELDLDNYCICFVFGCPILGPLWFNNDLLKINLHLGLSPYYVGSGTLFWPFYNNEVNLAGATWHELTEVLDMGRPIVRYKFNKAEGNYYDLVNILLKYSICNGLTSIKEKLTHPHVPLFGVYESDVMTKKYRRSDITKQEIDYVTATYGKDMEVDYDITSC